MALFDNNGPALDPATAGLLSAAFSALQASGPSPRPVSFGQVLGGAGQAGLGAYQQQSQLNQQAAFHNLQMQQLTESLAAQKRTQDAINQYAQSVPEKDRQLFLANPGEYIKSRGGAYNLRPGEKRMVGSDVVAEAPPNNVPVSLGGQTLFANPQTGATVGAPLMHTPTPSDRISLANLGIRSAEADPMGMLGIRGIAQQVGKELYGAGGSGGDGGVPVASPLLAAKQKVSPDVHGDEFLGSVPKPIADQVKALAEGRMQFPAGFALKSPYWQNMISMVSQYDPSFDAVNYNSRASTRRDFTSGQSSKNITALNTAIGHMGTLQQAADALGNSNTPAINYLVNQVRSATGDPRVNNFDLAKHAVANELMRVFRQVGASETETKAFEERLSSSSSPAQINEALKLGAELLHSRLDALNDTYQRGMGTTADVTQLLSPKAKAALASFENSSQKKETQPQPTAIKDAVEKSGWKYEPDQYEYRINNGVAQRRKKNG